MSGAKILGFAVRVTDSDMMSLGALKPQGKGGEEEIPEGYGGRLQAPKRRNAQEELKECA